MQLTIRDIAKHLGASEKTVLNWITKDSLPCLKVNDQYRFNRAEVLEWATERGKVVSPEILKSTNEEDTNLPSLSEALEAGGVIHKVPGNDKAEVLRAIVNAIPLPEGTKPELVFQLLMAREDLGSTALGEGIAVPHVRNPIVLHTRKPTLTLCFLSKAIDFQAIDQKPVHTLFTIISPNIKGHLHLLSRLSFALRDPGFKSAVANQLDQARILAEAKRVEGTLPR